jgi:hypothetical protein
MPNDQSDGPGLEEDRMVSRRVDHPTEAIEEDERSYPGAPSGSEPNRPAPDPDGTTERAERDLAAESDEPTRSE